MPSRKYAAFLITLILLAVSVSAASIIVDSPLTQGTQWSFEAEFNIDNANEIRINVASEQVLVGVVYGGEIQVVDSTVSSKVIDYSANGNSVVVLMTGRSEGVYQIEAKAYNNNSEVIDDALVDVEFFQPVSQSQQQSLENKISSLEGTMDGLNSTIVSMESQLDAKDDKISSLEGENQSLSNSVEQLQSKINLLEQDGRSQEENLGIVEDDLNLLMWERSESRKSPLAGLFAFGSQNSFLLIGLIAVIAIIVVGVFVKSRGVSIYSSSSGNETVIPKKDSFMDNYKPKPSPIRGFLNKIHKESESQMPTTKKKKWAVESYSPEVKKPKVSDKRFELGDLIKKEK
jgi:hypothetical protein